MYKRKKKRLTKSQIFARAQFRRLMALSREDFDRHIERLKLLRMLHENFKLDSFCKMVPLPERTNEPIRMYAK